MTDEQTTTKQPRKVFNIGQPREDLSLAAPLVPSYVGNAISMCAYGLEYQVLGANPVPKLIGGFPTLLVS